MPLEGERWTSRVVPLDTERIVVVLAAHRVDYLLVGGLAAVLHGWTGSTADADVLASFEPRNLERLLGALAELRARVYADPRRTDLREDGSPPGAESFDGTVAGLQRLTSWQFMTDAGELDVLFVLEPRGTYDELVAGKDEVAAFDMELPVVSLRDLVTLKREAGRQKDLRVLPELEALLDEMPG